MIGAIADKEYNGRYPEITKLDDKLETELQEIIPDIENKFTGGGKAQTRNCLLCHDRLAKNQRRF